MSRNENLFAFSFHDCCRRLRVILYIVSLSRRVRDDIDLEIKASFKLTQQAIWLLENLKFVKLMQGVGIKILIQFFYCCNFLEMHKTKNRVHLQYCDEEKKNHEILNCFAW